MNDYKLFILKPTVLMTAQVNQSVFTYPVDELTMDNVSTEHDVGGDWNLVRPEMTVLFGTHVGDDTYGRQRVRTHCPDGTTLVIGRSPAGQRDGEVLLQDNAWITVYENDLRVWMQIPWIDVSTDPPTIYKDSALAAADLPSIPPPIANAGIWMAGTVDPNTGLLRVQLPHGSQQSFPVYEGATTISIYEWEIPAIGALVGGYTNSDPVIQVDQSAGFALYRLTVWDDNGRSHSTYVGVYAYDPEDALSASMFIKEFQVVGHSHRRGVGQSLTIKVMQDLPRDEYPDGSIVMLWDGEPTGPADRSHMEFIGWHQSDPTKIVSAKEGVVRETTLICTDVGGRLSILHGFPITVERNSSLGGWYNMDNANWLKLIHYIGNWHSNAWIVADLLPDLNIADYDFVVRSAAGGSLFEQLHKNCQALVPDHHFAVNRFGQMLIRVDPFLQDLTDRTTEVQATLTASDWSEIEYEPSSWPKYHWIREEAVLSHGTNITPLFSIAPGASPGQGSGATVHGEQLALSQAGLNTSVGQRYARMNAYLGPVNLSLVGPSRRGIDPARLEWITLDVDAQYAAQRGLLFSDSRLLPQEITFNYHYGKEGVSRTVTVTAELETIGIDGEVDTSRSVEEEA